MSDGMNDGSFTPLMKWKLHEPIYRWMGELVEDRIVADIGCGDGLGIPYLHRAKRVIAVDRDISLMTSMNNSSSMAVEMLVADATRLPLSTGSAEVVIANALLEYLDKPTQFVAEIRRILRNDGIFLCGTKNVELSIRKPDGKLIYRNHVAEYSCTSLHQLLKPSFASVELFGLHLSNRAKQFYMDLRARSLEQKLVGWGVKSLLPRGLRKAVRRSLTGVGLEDLSPQDFCIRPDTAGAYYLIAKVR